jgi:hypothetical protein
VVTRRAAEKGAVLVRTEILVQVTFFKIIVNVNGMGLGAEFLLTGIGLDRFFLFTRMQTSMFGERVAKVRCPWYLDAVTESYVLKC